MHSKNYHLLTQKLDAFIRKYYKNQLLKGLIYFTAIALLYVLLLIVLAYFGNYGVVVRAVMFYSLVLCVGFLLLVYVLNPLSKIYQLRKGINHRDAAHIIGRHFPEVSDTLLNTLQLQQEIGSQQSESSLLLSAIEQKTARLNPIPFQMAIDLSKNVRYLKYLAAPVALYVLLYFAFPESISGGSERIIRYNKAFKKRMPFEFEFQNKTFNAEQFSDYEVVVNTKGAQMPEESYIIVQGNEYKMEKKGAGRFSYMIRSVPQNTTIQVFSGDVFSDEVEIKVLAKPILMNYAVTLHYPSYTHKAKETITSPGDISMPEGTKMEWKLQTRQTEHISFILSGQAMEAQPQGNGLFTFARKIFFATPYTIVSKSKEEVKGDSLVHQITVVADAYPSITLEEAGDSVSGKYRFFVGDISDDYGFTDLYFKYRIIKSADNKNQQNHYTNKPITIDKKQPTARFYYEFNPDEAQMQPGDELEYFFEVRDNDGVHGPKSAKSKTMMYRSASLKERQADADKATESMVSKMEESIREAKDLQKELKALESKMQEKRELTWEEKKKLTDLMERQKKLNNQMENLKKENEQKLAKEQEFRKENENILEKQKQLEKMFDQVLNDEMKKLIRQLEQMMQLQNKDMIKQEMEQMQMQNKDVEKELDRMLEQFKQLEVEKKWNDAIEKTQKLAEKQQELANKTQQIANDKKADKQQKAKALDEIKQQQQDLKQQFNELQKDLKELEKKNNELEKPNELGNTGDEQKQASDKMDKSKEQLDKENAEKAAKEQQEAADKLKEMEEKMSKNKEQNEEKEVELDIQALREILENTIQLSKDQEEILQKTKQVGGYNPQYIELAQQQKKLKDHSQIIEDSLQALGKRVIEIKSFVNREVSKMSDNLERSIKGFSQRNFMEIITRQQYVMTHANNLAVMLSEILSQMQAKQSDQQSQGKPKKGNKGKGKGKGNGNSQTKSMGQLKKMQEELNKQLREGLNKNGSSPGEKQDGKQGYGGMSSQEFARMAAQQQAIRQHMQKLMQQMGAKEKEQMGGGKALGELQKLMEQTEKELFNKKLTSEILMRQQEILTRLLESEKAERKQEQDTRREAEQAKEMRKPTPPAFDKYVQQKNKEKEMLQTISPDLKPYYKEKAKGYFNRIGTQ